MVKLTMIAEDHNSCRLPNIGPFIAGRARQSNASGLVVLAEGPFLSKRENLVLKRKIRPESPSEVYLAFFDYLTEKVSQNTGNSSISVANDIDSQAMAYLSKRGVISDLHIRQLEPVFFAGFSTPIDYDQTVNDAMAIPENITMYRTFKRILNDVGNMSKNDDGIERRILSCFHEVYSFIVEEIDKLGHHNLSIHDQLFEEISRLNTVLAILQKCNEILYKTAELRSAIHFQRIERCISQGCQEIFTISGASHVVDLFASPLIARTAEFANAEKEVVLVADSISDKQLKILSEKAKVTVI